MHMNEVTKDWRDKAIERYEESANVHSEENFTALQRALDVAFEAGKKDEWVRIYNKPPFACDKCQVLYCDEHA